MDSRLFDSLLESSGRLQHAAIDYARAAAPCDARERVLTELRLRRERLEVLIRLVDEEARLEEGAGRARRAAARLRRGSLSGDSPAHAA